MGGISNCQTRNGKFIIKKSFTAVTRAWGNDGNNGVEASRVLFNSDGTVDISISGSKRIGGALESNDYYDQGSFEFEASCNATSGVATAFWTFLYGEHGKINHEIDIELFNRNDVIYSSYIAEDSSTHVNSKIDYDISLGARHTYRFDWYRGKKVDYYIDNVLQATITTNVPTKPMKVWIGAWCPSWAGEQVNKDFQMKVYSFKYVSF